MTQSKEEKRPSDTSEILRNLSLMNQAVAALEEYGYQQPDPEWYRLDSIFCQSRTWLNEHASIRATTAKDGDCANRNLSSLLAAA